MATWGDSLTAGTGTTGGLTYPYDLTVLTHHAAFNGGAGGETSTQIRTRMIADTGKYTWPTIIWAGRNNITDPTTVKADIAAMVAALGHSNYIVLSIINRHDTASEYSGGVDYATIAQLNADLAAAYGAHFLDVRSYIVSLYDPNQPQDVIDHGHDAPPTSLCSDGLHLNNAGYQAVANYIYAHRAQLGIN